MMVGAIDCLILLLMISVLLILYSSHSHTLQLIKNILYVSLYLLPVWISIKIIGYNFTENISSILKAGNKLNTYLPISKQKQKVSFIIKHYIYGLSNSVFLDFLSVLVIILIVLSLQKFFDNDIELKNGNLGNEIFDHLYDFVCIFIKEFSYIIIKYVFDMVPVVLSIVAILLTLRHITTNNSIFYWLSIPVPMLSALDFIRISYKSGVPEIIVNMVKHFLK